MMMNIHKTIASVVFMLVAVINTQAQNVNTTRDTVYEIQAGKTQIKPALQFLGKEDKLYKTNADGRSAGHTSYVYQFSKQGIAITTVFYTPEQSLNGVIQNIELVDTSLLEQYDNGVNIFLQPTLNNIISLFGTPDKQNKSGTNTELVYTKREIIFIVDNTTHELLKLVCLH